MATRATQPVLPEEILEEIFLRLDAADDLARASAACTTFRRVVSARRFLRRFRSLHPPPVVGFLNFDAPGEFHPAEPPRRSAPAARALAQAADFTFSFLPRPNCWRVCDARDGRVLLYRRNRVTVVFADLVVCDPLHRRYVQMPPIPDDLAASTGGWGMQEFDPFLVPASAKEKEEVEEEKDLSFRLICAVQGQDKLVTFHFSSATGEWRGHTFHRATPLYSSLVRFQGLFEHHCAHGCFFWTVSVISSYLFMLDMREMKLSVVDTPHCEHSGPQAQAIVEAGEGMIGLLVLGDGTLDLYCKALRSNGTGSEEWKHERIIPLPEFDCFWQIHSAVEGYALLQATPRAQVYGLWPQVQYYTLDLKTWLFERLCVSTQHIRGAHLYASFPPLLSPPSL